MSRRSQIVTLFVQNVPLALHWSGLRQVFGRQSMQVEHRTGERPIKERTTKTKLKNYFSGKQNSKLEAENQKAQAKKMEGLRGGDLDILEWKKIMSIQGHVEEESL
ncbi:hypothetical protein V6N13_142127 [Hibiscus sabdariffa]